MTNNLSQDVTLEKYPSLFGQDLFLSEKTLKNKANSVAILVPMKIFRFVLRALLIMNFLRMILTKSAKGDKSVI